MCTSPKSDASHIKTHKSNLKNKVKTLKRMGKKKGTESTERGEKKGTEFYSSIGNLSLKEYLGELLTHKLAKKGFTKSTGQ